MSHADGPLPIESPLVVANPDAERWDLRCDVLVCGFGGAGAAAAIAAKEAGAAVMIVERFEGGGATAKSGGVVYAGGGTRQQQALGYEDTPDAMFRYLRLETGDAVSEPTLKRFCEDSRGLLEWLESLGAKFDSTAPPPKTSYPKDGVFLYYSGNESVPAFAEAAKPAPRGHRTHGSFLSGKDLFAVLRARVTALAIPVQAQSAVRRLIVDTLGHVIGVEAWRLPPGSAAAQKHAKLQRRAEAVGDIAPGWARKLRAQALELESTQSSPVRIRATGGVILSTGGFIFNREMVQKYAPKFREALRLGATGCDGSGIRLGQSAGAAVGRMEKVSAWRFINPPTAWPTGVIVDEAGKRFCNEQQYGARLGVEMCENHGGRAFLILDRQQRKSAIREALFGGLWFFQSVPTLLLMLFAPRARTLTGLAAKIGVSGADLAQTIETYNAAAEGRVTDIHGKAAAMMHPLRDAPYYALNISANNRNFPCPAITLGGLRVDEAGGAVLDAQGKRIGGLYAAGRAAVGVASNNYISGLSIADALWSGRRAGAQAASAATQVAARA